MSLLPHPIRVLLLGAPGAGKGTQTSKLLKYFPEIKPISSGDLLRREIQNKTAVGIQASGLIAAGGLLPDGLVSNLVISDLEKQNLLNRTSSWLLDGFPRTINQAKLLNTELESHNTGLNLVVKLDVPESVILQRVENRWVHIPSGRIYNLDYNPPKIPFKDDVTGEPLSKRPDDNPEVFKQRLIKFHETITPLEEFYSSLGILHSVQGETSDIIFPKLLELVKNEKTFKN